MIPKKVILDCDPGSDDAIAMMLAMKSDAIDLIGVTTVNGNRIVPKTTENALRVVQFMKSSVPVYRGCEEPIICNEIPSRKPGLPRVTLNDCHGDFLPLPAAEIRTEKELRSLTNLAMALRIEPKIAGKIKQLVIMGGGHCGANASPAAEFNFYADPEAAKIVMDSAIPKVILPLDATWRACLSEEKCRELAQLGTPEAKVAAALVQKRIDNLKVNDVSEHNYALRHQAGTVAGAMLYRYDNHMAPIRSAIARFVSGPTAAT